MSTTYSKWEQELGRSLRNGWEEAVWTRRVTGTWWFGLIRERVEKVVLRLPPGHDPYSGRVGRVLNSEPEPTPPEPKLEDRAPVHGSCPWSPRNYGPYRFPTEALRKELARREAEGQPVWLDTSTGNLSRVNRRTGPADRRKAKRAPKGRR